MNRELWLVSLILALSGACGPGEDYEGEFATDFEAQELEVEAPEFGGELWKSHMVWARESELRSAYQDAQEEYSEALRLADDSLEKAATYAALGNLAVKKLHQPLIEPFRSESGLNPGRNPREQLQRYYRSAIAEARKSQDAPDSHDRGVKTEIEAANNLSVLLIEWQRHPDAVEVLAGALTRVPAENLPIYLYNYALALYGSDRRPEAVDQLLRGARVENENRSNLDLAWDWLKSEPELQSSERLQRLLEVALEKRTADVAQWVIEIRLAELERSGTPVRPELLTDLAHYFQLVEMAGDELQQEWIPRIEAVGLEPVAASLWNELKALLSQSVPTQTTVTTCERLFPSWADGGESSAVFGALLRQTATREYRLSQNREALCLFQRLWTWPTGESTDAQYPLALLAAKGSDLDPTGRWLHSIARDLSDFQEPGLDLLAGDAYLARHRRTGQPEDLHQALASWKRGLRAEPDSMLAAHLHERCGDAWRELSRPKDAAREMLRAADLFQHSRPDWEERQANEAAELMRQAIATDPDDQEAQELLLAARERIEGRLDERGFEEEWAMAEDEAAEESEEAAEEMAGDG